MTKLYHVRNLNLHDIFQDTIEHINRLDVSVNNTITPYWETDGLSIHIKRNRQPAFKTIAKLSDKAAGRWLAENFNGFCKDETLSDFRQTHYYNGQLPQLIGYGDYVPDEYQELIDSLTDFDFVRCTGGKLEVLTKQSPETLHTFQCTDEREVAERLCGLFAMLIPNIPTRHNARRYYPIASGHGNIACGTTEKQIYLKYSFSPLGMV